MNIPHRLGIVQEYVPKYRVGFFTRLIDRLREKNIDAIVIAGNPTGENANRADATQGAPWIRRAQDHQFTVGRNGPRFYGYLTDRHWRDCDGLIFNLRGTAADLYTEIAKKRRSGRRLGVYGHLSHSVKPPNAIDLALERWQMRHTDHVFSYTAAGAEVAVAAGLSPESVTAVMNSVDLAEELAALSSVDPAAIDDLIDRYSLTPGKIFGYVGGLDAAKRIPFLMEALDHAWQTDPEIKIIVGGKGDQEHLLKPATDRGQVILRGFADAREKALIYRLSQALLCPGRVGLVAVEALAAGIPLLTTNWPLHAPEIEYLSPGEDVLYSGSRPIDFSDLILSQTNKSGKLPQHVGKKYPTIDEMASNFAGGVEKMFS